MCGKIHNHKTQCFWQFVVGRTDSKALKKAILEFSIQLVRNIIKLLMPAYFHTLTATKTTDHFMFYNREKTVKF